MLFSEFLEGTGCRDNDYNHKVYQDLEIMYMNSDLTKQQIYEYGKKLVDNSKNEQELKLEANINAEIQDLKGQLKELREQLKVYQQYHREDPKDPYWKGQVAWYRSMMQDLKRRIAGLKWVLE